MTDLSAAPVRPRSWIRFLPAMLVVAGVGAVVGYNMGQLQSQGGMSGLGVAVLGMVLGAVAGVVVLVGIVGWLLPGGRGRRITVPSFMAAGLLVAGATLGFASVPVLGLGYRPPVTLTAAGSVTLRLDDVDFVASEDAHAGCASVEDDDEVGAVDGLELGELQEGTLRGSFSRSFAEPLAAGGQVELQLFIDGADLDGGAQPLWSGSGTIAELDPDGRGGVVTFDGLPLQGDPMGGGEGLADAWPSALAGDLRWGCEPWRAEAAMLAR